MATAAASGAWENVDLVMNDEGEEECEVYEENEDEDEEPYMGNGLFTFMDSEETGGGDEVPDRDPLSTEDGDMFFDDGAIVIDLTDDSEDQKPANLTSMQKLNRSNNYRFAQETTRVVEPSPLPVESAEEQHTPLVIKSVSSLRVEYIAGISSQYTKAASFRNLDAFRCFLCRRDFDTFDEFLVHRTKTRIHLGVPYDAEREKAFCCGICQRPWNQPRKALACAVFGHDPLKIYNDMFVHSCPSCPDTRLAYHSLAAVGRHWAEEHIDRPIPTFYLFGARNDQLPIIKVSLQETSSVNESMVKDNPNLVLDNFLATGPKSTVDNTNNKLLKVYRCVSCQKSFETRREVDIHHCSVKHVQAKPPFLNAPRRYICDDCGREFPCGRNFRFHLLRAGVCRKGVTIKKEDLPYKCIFCGSRYNSFKSYMSHRSKNHLNIPHNAAAELPFACKICEKPAFVMKEAMTCALFGHDPSGLLKTMFRYKCTQCTTFGFHSQFALKRHWKTAHPELPVPLFLESVTSDKPLPNVTISLDQLLSLKQLQQFGRTLVIEREVHPSSPKFIQIKPAIPSEKALDEASFVIGEVKTDQTFAMVHPKKVEVAYLPQAQDDVANKVRKSLIEESIEKNECVICNKSFKDIRRHFKVHDQSRFSGPPKHKCVCGKEYHLRNSLHSHWKKNRYCKLQYGKKNGNNMVDDKIKTELSEESKPPSTKEYVLRIPSPATTPFEDSNIKIELPEISTIFDPEPEHDNNVSESINNSNSVDLYAEYEKLDAQTSMEYEFGTSTYVKSPSMEYEFGTSTNVKSPSIDFEFETSANVKSPSIDFEFETSANQKSPSVKTEIIDFRNFIHLDIEEVHEDECDNNVQEHVSVSSDHEKWLQPKRPRVCICVICNTGFPSQLMFMNHMATAHKDEYPYACSHCGKRFKLNDQRKKHETIHDPTRFNGEPKFACDKCDQKYHLKTSLETHRKIKHFGYVKPKSRANLPIVQHRTIGVARKKTTDSHECTDCRMKFNFQFQLRQHVARVHTGERLYKCHMCEKGFFNSAGLRWHVRHTHENIASNRPAVKSLRTKFQKSSDGKGYACNKCSRTFSKPFQLEQHNLLHTGEKPHACDHCGRRFRLRKLMVAHKRTHDEFRKSDLCNTFKCCVCGRQDFLRATELHRHRLNSHKNVPYDKTKEKAFGCGVCEKPYLLRGQAMVCAILGHDPTYLQEVMFKHKCPACPKERLGYHNYASIRNHWLKEHADITMPAKFLPSSQNTVDALPCITINKEKAAEIREKGPSEAYDFPLVVEFDLLDPQANTENLSRSPIDEAEYQFEDNSAFDSPTEEELFLSTEISFEDAVAAVKAIVSSGHYLRTNTQKKASPTSPRKRKPSKQPTANLRDSLADDRALGNKKIAKVLERIRTARARKACFQTKAQESEMPHLVAEILDENTTANQKL